MDRSPEQVLGVLGVLGCVSPLLVRANPGLFCFASVVDRYSF